jgi:hypothetical protein
MLPNFHRSSASTRVGKVETLHDHCNTYRTANDSCHGVNELHDRRASCPAGSAAPPWPSRSEAAACTADVLPLAVCWLAATGLLRLSWHACSTDETAILTAAACPALIRAAAPRRRCVPNVVASAAARCKARALELPSRAAGPRPGDVYIDFRSWTAV